VVEARAIHRVVGDRPLVTSIKGVTGHCLGAAGAVAAICAVLTVQNGLIPPTANLDQLDPAVPVEVVAGLRRHQVAVALSNSFGFGGQNAVLVVSAP
jgi:3-oxoacyl-[acyl-carrier-protein] synthase II